ncbi:hypothetical protein CSAL01_02464 [Colletotrichum salicis]|uniref:Uncharacterized protein n=1 Tax=Colletotrichum salicis TaxID=1209931 RepID=A0A135RYA6_9PEZI|nr:hypothetical protein CSAL01_02464 [Colletotrichum salicis]
MAVIRSDFDEVGRVLSRSPDSIAELDIYGRSPLHLSAEKPEILETLVEVADANILNQRDKTGATALETAMILSSKHCVNGQEYERYAGSGIRTYEMRNAAGNVPALDILLEDASDRARHCYVRCMKEARNPRNPERTLPNKGLCEERNTGETRPMSGISIWRGRDFQESPLQAPKKLQVWAEADQATGWDWMFHEIDTIYLAELLRRRGSMPGPSVFLDLRLRENRLRPNLEPLFVSWLVDHGGDLFLRSPVGPINRAADDGNFAAHYVFYLLGTISWIWLESWRTEWRAAKSDAFEKGITTESYWIDRILYELEELDGDELTEAERRGAEELGVEWRGPIESESDYKNPYDKHDLEHYFYELDLICPEYKEPWPEGTHPTHWHFGDWQKAVWN